MDGITNVVNGIIGDLRRDRAMSFSRDRWKQRKERMWGRISNSHLTRCLGKTLRRRASVLQEALFCRVSWCVHDARDEGGRVEEMFRDPEGFRELSGQLVVRRWV